MIDRLTIKQQAKGLVSNDRNRALVSGLIIVVVMALANITTEKVTYFGNNYTYYTRTTTAFSFIFGLLIANTVFEVSKARLFSNFIATGNINYNDFGYGFSNYGSSFVGMFLVNLYTALWTLLLIVPGIVKGVGYSLTPYILADNPELKPNEAITLSSVMTYGYKMDIFVFTLSFLGWFILTGLTVGIAGLYVMPYYHSSFAILYYNIKEKAIADGRVSADIFATQTDYTVA